MILIEKQNQNQDNYDDDYEKAIKQSMEEEDNRYNQQEKEEEENKFKAFQGSGVSLATNANRK